eukprot:3742012-Amphidinium_carterae.1
MRPMIISRVIARRDNAALRGLCATAWKLHSLPTRAEVALVRGFEVLRAQPELWRVSCERLMGNVCKLRKACEFPLKED